MLPQNTVLDDPQAPWAFCSAREAKNRTSASGSPLSASNTGAIFCEASCAPSGVLPSDVATVSKAFATLKRMFGMGSDASCTSGSSTVSCNTSIVREGSMF